MASFSLLNNKYSNKLDINKLSVNNLKINKTLYLNNPKQLEIYDEQMVTTNDQLEIYDEQSVGYNKTQYIMDLKSEIQLLNNDIKYNYTMSNKTSTIMVDPESGMFKLTLTINNIIEQSSRPHFIINNINLDKFEKIWYNGKTKNTLSAFETINPNAVLKADNLSSKMIVLRSMESDESDKTKVTFFFELMGNHQKIDIPAAASQILTLNNTTLFIDLLSALARNIGKKLLTTAITKLKTVAKSSVKNAAKDFKSDAKEAAKDTVKKNVGMEVAITGLDVGFTGLDFLTGNTFALVGPVANLLKDVPVLGNVMNGINSLLSEISSAPIIGDVLGIIGDVQDFIINNLVINSIQGIFDLFRGRPMSEQDKYLSSRIGNLLLINGHVDEKIENIFVLVNLLNVPNTATLIAENKAYVTIQRIINKSTEQAYIGGEWVWEGGWFGAWVWKHGLSYKNNLFDLGDKLKKEKEKYLHAHMDGKSTEKSEKNIAAIIEKTTALEALLIIELGKIPDKSWVSHVIRIQGSTDLTA